VCGAECEYAAECRKELVPLRVEAGYTPDGWLGILGLGLGLVGRVRVRVEAGYTPDGWLGILGLGLVGRVRVRVEAGYTPDGWLGIRCTGKLYFDFTDPQAFDSKMEELVKELRIKLEGKKRRGL